METSDYKLPSWYYKVANIISIGGTLFMLGMMVWLFIKITPLFAQYRHDTAIWYREYPKLCKAQGGHILYDRESGLANMCITGRQIIIKVPRLTIPAQ